MVKNHLYVWSLVLTLTVFMLGITLGNMLAESKFSRMEKYLEYLSYDTSSIYLEKQLLPNRSQYCEFMSSRMKEILSIKTEIGRKLDFEDIPQEEKDMLFKKYAYLLGSYYLTIRDLRKECNFSVPEIYFFFDGSEKSRAYGRVLDKVVFDFSKRGEDIIVYPISTVRSEPFYRLMKVMFSNPDAPSVYVNRTEVNVTEEDIKKAVCREYGICI